MLFLIVECNGYILFDDILSSFVEVLIGVISFPLILMMWIFSVAHTSAVNDEYFPQVVHYT